MRLQPPRFFRPQRPLLALLAVNVLVLFVGTLLASQALVIVSSKEVHVPLSPDATSETGVTQRWLIRLRDDGSALIAGNPVPAQKVAEVITAQSKSHPGSVARIEAEGEVPFFRLREAMEACATGGLHRVDVAVPLGGGA